MLFRTFIFAGSFSLSLSFIYFFVKLPLEHFPSLNSFLFFLLWYYCCSCVFLFSFTFPLPLFHFPLLNIFSHEVFLPEHEKFTTCRISRSKRNRNWKTNENSRKCSFRTTNVCIRNVSKASGMRTPTEELKQHRDSQLSSCSTNNHTPTHTFIHSLSLLVILP